MSIDSVNLTFTDRATKLQHRIAGAFIRLALWISTLIKPTPAPAGEGKVHTTLRIEADVETPLTGKQIAALLRRVSEHMTVSPTEQGALLSLAEGFMENCRVPAEGTRGSLLLTGDNMNYDPEIVLETLDHMVQNTRRVTREGGNLVELKIEAVIHSNATTVDAFPLTTFEHTFTNDKVGDA